jgi:hypothetical protein
VTNALNKELGKDGVVCQSWQVMNIFSAVDVKVKSSVITPDFKDYKMENLK